MKFQRQVVPASHPVDDVLPTVSSASALGSVVNSVSEKEGSVGIPTLPAVLSTQALRSVAVPVSEKEGSVGVPTLPAILPACALGSVENSASEKEKPCGFSHTARSFVLCATCLRVRSAEVAIFQFRKKSRFSRIFASFRAEQLGLEPWQAHSYGVADWRSDPATKIHVIFSSAQGRRMQQNVFKCQQTSSRHASLERSHVEGSFGVLGTRTGAKSSGRCSTPGKFDISPSRRSGHLIFPAGQTQSMDSTGKGALVQCSATELQLSFRHSSHKGSVPSFVRQHTRTSTYAQ